MEKKCEIGVFGLGVMGAGLASNMLSRGIRTAVFSVSREERDRFAGKHPEDAACRICGTETEFLETLEVPRKIFLMITAGTAVDEVIGSMLPRLSPGDVILEGGNSHYRDSIRREEACRRAGVHFVGVGVSGGEEGARKGPSLMAGGSREGYETCAGILQTIAAGADGEPCCGYFGKGGAGHYVKMVHNGIEYAVMQLLSETYLYLKHSCGLPHDAVLRIFRKWNDGELASFLMDGCVRVLEKTEEDGTPLIERIRDRAGQKGTGRWALEEALEREIYAPTIFEAVEARTVSGRERPAGKEKGCTEQAADPGRIAVEQKRLGKALYLAVLCCFDQGSSLIRTASETYGWEISLNEVIRVWREGCILRCDLMKRLPELYAQDPGFLVRALPENEREDRYAALKAQLKAFVEKDACCAAWMSVYSYIRYGNTDRMPVQLLQGLRDYFGSHTYERFGAEGAFHTKWKDE